jgi:hypothetical protein
MNRLITSLTATAASVAMLVGTTTSALAQAYQPAPQYPPQSYQPPPQNYPQQGYQQPPQGYQPPPQGYQQGYTPPPQQGYQQGPYQDPALQPPPGYSAEDAQRDATPAERDYDRRYAAAAEAWSQANCVRQEENRTAAGAIIGGVLGAVIGSNIAGGRDRGAGAIVGGALGAVAGGAIANSSGPGCPPGFALRGGAPAFYYGPPPGGAVVVYDAPTWYNPWIWYDGAWIYRPYPYHRYWGEHYYRGGERERDRRDDRGDRDYRRR